MERFGLGERNFVVQALRSQSCVYAFVYIYLEERVMILIRFLGWYLWPMETQDLG